MEQIYESRLTVTPGCADCFGRLGVYETFRAFMDMAAIHAELLGVGFEAMAERGLFWLTVKTRVEFIKRPSMAEELALRTWPEAPERVRANRSYEADLNGETVIRGRTEWAVINTGSGRLVPMRGIFPEELPFDKPSASPEPFSRLEDEFLPGEKLCDYRVSSVDIDVGGHMNNAAYVRALMSAFTKAELAQMDISCAEVIFRAPCFEGDVLDIFRRRTPGGYALRMSREGETVILAEISLR